ncbi:TetR family transcriptional regulator [Streptomyces sp. Pv4-95]|uniref:TetR family transcriptional regulator n=1 Tax=Streptomyces sp. Pv4-95 TaxID=3049543 RepID=UPI003891EADE
MTQQRAERTRRRVLQAGAAEFARRGYAATTLTHITRTAGVTMGSITFHFASKRALADEVCAQGHRVTREAVARSAADATCALQAVVDITHALVRLLGEDDLVRAASRLGGEAGERDGWYTAWLPSLHAVSTRADREGTLQAGVDPATVTVLAVSLVAAAETAALQAVCACAGTVAAVQLTRAWWALLGAIVSPGSTPGLSLGGPPRPADRPGPT